MCTNIRPLQSMFLISKMTASKPNKSPSSVSFSIFIQYLLILQKGKPSTGNSKKYMSGLGTDLVSVETMLYKEAYVFISLNYRDKIRQDCSSSKYTLINRVGFLMWLSYFPDGSPPPDAAYTAASGGCQLVCQVIVMAQAHYKHYSSYLFNKLQLALSIFTHS